jgi:hypothetical protein
MRLRKLRFVPIGLLVISAFVALVFAQGGGISPQGEIFVYERQDMTWGWGYSVSNSLSSTLTGEAVLEYMGGSSTKYITVEPESLADEKFNLPIDPEPGTVVTLTIRLVAEGYVGLVSQAVTLVPPEYRLYLPVINKGEPTVNPTPEPTATPAPVDIAQSMELTFADPEEGAANIHDGNPDTVWGPFPTDQEVQVEFTVADGSVQLVGASVENTTGQEWWLKINNAWMPAVPVVDSNVNFQFEPRSMTRVKFLCREGNCSAGEVHIWVQP